LQVIQEISRNKAALSAAKEGITDFEPEPFVQLDESMVILHVDITFEDYNTSVLNNRNQGGYMTDNMMQQPMMMQNNYQGMMMNQANHPNDTSYFYLRDNPQCSSSPNNTNSGPSRFVHPNQPYMPNSMQQQRYQAPFLNQNAYTNLMAIQSCSLAISSVHKIKELQKKYTDLRNIVLIIKKVLAKHNLHKPYSGGLNSYSIVLMTSTFLEKFGINHCSALS